MTSSTFLLGGKRRLGLPGRRGRREDLVVAPASRPEQAEDEGHL